jgi:hypothetical protein
LPSRTKTWRFKYHPNGKREKVMIGAHPAFTIKQAGGRHDEPSTVARARRGRATMLHPRASSPNRALTLVTSD